MDINAEHLLPLIYCAAHTSFVFFYSLLKNTNALLTKFISINSAKYAGHNACFSYNTRTSLSLEENH